MFKNLFTRFYILSPLKCLELQVYLSKMYFNSIDFSLQIFGERTYFQFYLDLYFLTIDIDFSRRCDHPGARINLAILIFHFETNLYDIRHWDDELESYSKD